MFKKTILGLLLNGFSPLFELLATHYLSEEHPAELGQPTPMNLSNTVWARKDLTKQTIGS